jgi:hypothetical protein
MDRDTNKNFRAALEYFIELELGKYKGKCLVSEGALSFNRKAVTVTDLEAEANRAIRVAILHGLAYRVIVRETEKPGIVEVEVVDDP